MALESGDRVLSPGRPWAVLLGHSHLQALMDAEAKRTTDGQSMAGAVEFVNMLDPSLAPNVHWAGTEMALNAALTRRLNRTVAPRGTDAVTERPMLVDCVSGNEYHAFGLVNHVRPFDFVLPSAPGMMLQDGAEVLPAGMVAAAMRHAMEYGLTIPRALRNATTLPIYHLQSPPPVPDENHIRGHAAQFKEAIDRHGIAPPLLRWKLWRLQSELYHKACEDLGIRFVPTPAGVLDADGFMAQPGWHSDPTHANAWFGGHVMAQLIGLRDEETAR